ncbi:THO complex subunit 5 homolog [Aplysia californica]|uniref:THO complex subunit 5 homolog n=1 Tax=Aplysia californica TaxID=6500 RepID=A0ABM0JS59_APLCA|nr:THO complex subunit 5 homolog [Aplysia californica]
MSKDEHQDGKKKRLLKTDATSPAHSDAKKIKSDQLNKESRTPLTEEDEALQRDPLTDLKSFHASCEFLKCAIKDMKDMKKSSNDTSAEISGLQTDVTVHFVHMKKLNRLAHFRCRKVRETTNEAKHKIDQCHLQLQNLLYEAMHLQKEITKCMEFKSKDEEIELVPVEKFYSDAPESVSNPTVTKSDVHRQMLARLEWELEQRKQLASKLTETKSSKEKISEEIQSKQDYLDTLQPKLSAILQATRPVQDYLDMPYDDIREEHQVAQHLPMPLYILYMQTSAYKEACDKCLKVSIQGDMDAAKTVKSMSSIHLDLDEESDSDTEEQEKRDSKRRRKTVEARQVEKKNRVLRKHPLNVVLDISDQDGADLQLTFNYFLALNIVTVNVKVTPGPKVTSTSVSGSELLSSDFILDELYPGDHGNDSPNVANHYELKKHGLQEFSSYLSQVGRPYLWCQWMGGLQFLEPEVDGQDSKNTEDSTASHDAAGMSRVVAARAKHGVSATHMQRTITLLRERMKARIALLHQLASLERGIIPVPAEVTRLFPAKVNSLLSSWKRSTFEDLQLLPHAQRFIKAGVVKPMDMVFVAVVDRASAKMTAHVVLTADCPEVAPVFIVEIMWQSQRTALNDVHIIELEEEVNLHFGELVPGKCRDHLLSSQLQRLLMCLDVYLETDTPASSTVPIEIPKEKMMPRTSRGRARSKPYKFVPEMGIFTHRN